MGTITLTDAQIAALKAFVSNSADPEIVDARARGATVELAAALNVAAAGPVKAWNMAVGAQTLDEATPWTGFDTLDGTAAGGKKLSWLQIFNFPRDFSKNIVRNWVTDIWGAATTGSNAEKILNACTVNATVAQNAIGGTTKATGTVSAIDRYFAGVVSQSDAQRILAP